MRARPDPETPARIVFLGSISGIRPKTGGGAYGAQKSALHVITGVMAVASYTTGLLLGLLVLCFYPRLLSSRSVMAAFLVGLIAMTLIRFLTDIAWPWHALLGTAFVAGFGILFSALFHGRSPLDRSSRGTNL